MEEYPEHRLNFFSLLQALNHECFDVLISLPPEHFRLIVDAVVWAFKHTMRNVAEIGVFLSDFSLKFVMTKPEYLLSQNIFCNSQVNKRKHSVL